MAGWIFSKWWWVSELVEKGGVEKIFPEQIFQCFTTSSSGTQLRADKLWTFTTCQYNARDISKRSARMHIRQLWYGLLKVLTEDNNLHCDGVGLINF